MVGFPVFPNRVQRRSGAGGTNPHHDCLNPLPYRPLFKLYRTNGGKSSSVKVRTHRGVRVRQYLGGCGQSPRSIYLIDQSRQLCQTMRTHRGVRGTPVPRRVWQSPRSIYLIDQSRQLCQTMRTHRGVRGTPVPRRVWGRAHGLSTLSTRAANSARRCEHIEGSGVRQYLGGCGQSPRFLGGKLPTVAKFGMLRSGQTTCEPFTGTFVTLVNGIKLV
jgi:hypothetical protein